MAFNISTCIFFSVHSQIFEIDTDSRIQPSGLEKYGRIRRDMEKFSPSYLEERLIDLGNDNLDNDLFNGDHIKILKDEIEDLEASNNAMRPNQMVKRYRVKCLLQ